MQGSPAMSKIATQNLMTIRAQIIERNATLAQAAKMEPAEKEASFSGVFEKTLARTNNEQAKSSALTEAYERGDTTDIATVMLQRQKASIAFETTLQVRNKLVSAYKDIMNMPL